MIIILITMIIIIIMMMMMMIITNDNVDDYTIHPRRRRHHQPASSSLSWKISPSSLTDEFMPDNNLFLLHVHLSSSIKRKIISTIGICALNT